MRKRKTALLSALLVLPCLSSCAFFRTSSSQSQGNGETTGVYSEPSNYPLGSSKENLNLTNVGAWNGQVFMPSTGESAILVVPVEFQDDYFTDVELARIQKSFFGESSQTGWESVASYYDKSSYHQLQITGAVTDPVRLNTTVAGAEAQYSNNDSFVQDVLFGALEALEKSNLDFSEFDANGDGYLDAVWMVYSSPYSESSDLYWAFTTWTFDNTQTFGGYRASSYSWASVEFLERGRYYPYFSSDNGDAHTFIHETGHLMGLDDYYSYDNGTDGNVDSPTGGAVMMDYNIGDHDAYSKFLLGWIDPTVITESYLQENDYRLSLDSFGKTGQALILPIGADGETDFNGTPFDEYLILEYYTPDGLNEQDAQHQYENMRMFTKPGVLVYHVDSRIGKMVADFTSSVGVRWDGYCYDRIPPSQNQNYLFYYLYSNTRSSSLDKTIQSDASNYYCGRLISLLSADDRKTTFETPSTMATNDSLFQEGDRFLLGGGSFANFVFDDGSRPEYGFTVEESNGSSCVLRFEEA